MQGAAESGDSAAEQAVWALPGRKRMHQVTMMQTMPAKKMNTPHFMLQSMVTKHWPMTKVKSCTAEGMVSNAWLAQQSTVDWR